MIRAGYKQTEIGVIPEDWEVELINEVAIIKRGKFTPRPRNNPIYYGGNIPFVQTGDVTKCEGRIYTYTQTLNEKGLAVSKLFKRGTILMTIAANIGYTGILELDMACPDSLIGINGTKADNLFLNFCFQYRREEIESLSTSGAQKNLNIVLFSNFKVPLPPLPEQTAIATVLSDTNKLLQAIEKKIAKKRLIKQGAMQELLKPKEGWGLVSLCSLLENESIPSGIYKDKKLYGKGNKIIKLGDVFKNDIYNPKEAQRVVLTVAEIEKYKVKLNDIIIALASVKLEGVGKVMLITKLDETTSFDHNVALIRLKKGNAKYLSYQLKSNLVRKEVAEKATQVGTTFLKASSLKQFRIPLPPLPEQIAIAGILSDMDNEIDNLEMQLTKYKQVKQGLMQNLLTGKIRLV